MLRGSSAISNNPKTAISGPHLELASANHIASNIVSIVGTAIVLSLFVRDSDATHESGIE
jgi:hypothetical protein